MTWKHKLGKWTPVVTLIVWAAIDAYVIMTAGVDASISRQGRDLSAEWVIAAWVPGVIFGHMLLHHDTHLEVRTSIEAWLAERSL